MWSNYLQPPVLPLCSASWRPCVITCNVTTCSAVSLSATTQRMTGTSQVMTVHSAECISISVEQESSSSGDSLCSSCGCTLRGTLCSKWLLPCLCVPVKEEALDAPSLARGSKRSLSGVSPPYAAPLSPKHLRTEAHPSEGTAYAIHILKHYFLNYVFINL